MISYDALQTKITAACREEETIRAVILVGSRARDDRPIDDQADLDLILFTSDSSAFTTMPDWIKSPATIWLPDFSYTGGGDPEWMVLYEGGCKVDYIFTNIGPKQRLQEALETTYYRIIFPRGLKVVLDKTGSEGETSSLIFKNNEPAHPTAAEFKATNDNFLLEASRTAKLIRRQDLWRAKVSCDTNLKRNLLTLIEWHSRTKYGLTNDTWYDGRYLSEWADPTVTATLPDTFAVYEAVDLQRAFLATLTLYHKLASETAAALNFPYPTPGQAAALDWLKTF